jgi:uncharacterized membrane protein
MAQQLVLDQGVEDAKQTARVLYLAHACTFFFSLGMLSFLPLMFNYMKRPDTVGTLVYSHHTWMIRSFWTYVVLMIVAVALFVMTLGLGFFLAWGIGACAWLWKAYRLIRGFLDLNSNRAMPV